MTTPDQIRILSIQDIPSLAIFVHRQQQEPANQCIQTGIDDSVASLISEMKKGYASDEMLWVSAGVPGKYSAAMGAEYDPESGRAWLRGPFATEEWEAASQRLWQTLLEKLSKKITRFDSFLNLQNHRGIRFYESLGFVEKTRAHVYEAHRTDYISAPMPSIPARTGFLQTGDHEGFCRLHDLVFPKTFYTGAQIIQKLDSTHHVWIAKQDDLVVGYLYGMVEPWSTDGYIEFLGVSPDRRGIGLGGALIQQAMTWFFEIARVGRVGLTVEDDNAHARSLYQRSGFQLKYTGINHRLETGEAE